MIISLIVAMDDNRLIGSSGALPWKLPAELKRFREVTLGKPIIMGRKTYESIGKPLPERVNIVVSHDAHEAPGCIVVRSPEEALEIAKQHGEEVMIIGGATIYKHFLPQADRLYLTFVHGDFSGDIYFPKVDYTKWQEISREPHLVDERNPYPFEFVVLTRPTTVQGQFL